MGNILGLSSFRCVEQNFKQIIKRKKLKTLTSKVRITAIWTITFFSNYFFSWVCFSTHLKSSLSLRFSVFNQNSTNGGWFNNDCVETSTEHKMKIFQHKNLSMQNRDCFAFRKLTNMDSSWKAFECST